MLLKTERKVSQLVVSMICSLYLLEIKNTRSVINKCATYCVFNRKLFLVQNKFVLLLVPIFLLFGKVCMNMYNQ